MSEKEGANWGGNDGNWAVNTVSMSFRTSIIMFFFLQRLLFTCDEARRDGVLPFLERAGLARVGRKEVVARGVVVRVNAQRVLGVQNGLVVVPHVDVGRRTVAPRRVVLRVEQQRRVGVQARLVVSLSVRACVRAWVRCVRVRVCVCARERG